jgi:hypothetical protein
VIDTGAAVLSRRRGALITPVAITSAVVSPLTMNARQARRSMIANESTTDLVD